MAGLLADPVYATLIRKRPYLDNDGRPREVTPLHKLMTTLIYLQYDISHGGRRDQLEDWRF